MKFDKKRVYTAVNADMLNTGDLVYISYTFRELKIIVEAEDKEDLKYIHFIRPDDKVNRFYVGSDDNDGKYMLAYLVCPARNEEAYKAWRYGESVEMQTDTGWIDVDSDELEEKPDCWLYRNLRVKAPCQCDGHYRPYKDVDELIISYKHSHCYKDNDDIMPLIWVKKKRGTAKKLITAFDEEEDLVSVDGKIYDLEYLYKDFTFLDGTPCGVEEV